MTTTPGRGRFIAAVNSDASGLHVKDRLRAGRSGVLLAVHAQPGAKKDGFAGLFDGRLRVRTNAPPALNSSI